MRVFGAGLGVNARGWRARLVPGRRRHRSSGTWDRWSPWWSPDVCRVSFDPFAMPYGRHRQDGAMAADLEGRLRDTCGVRPAHRQHQHLREIAH